MASSMQSDETEQSFDNVGIDSCLQKVLKSKGFTNAERMQAFLGYVVHEVLEGRGAGIKAKTIAQDVYGRTSADDGDPDNLVRVDARRLRRCLAEYYETDGRADPIRFHIDSGGYAPRFEAISPEPDPAASMDMSEPAPNGARANPGKKPRLIAIVLAVLLLVFAGAALMYFMSEKEKHASQAAETETTRQRVLERQALLEKSHKTLKAANLAESVRSLMLPLFDVSQQILVSDMFRHIVSVDPEYFAGYAGAAQTLSTLAVLSPDPEKKQQYLAEANVMVEKAFDLGPTRPWTQAAAGWNAFARKDYDRALELTARAAELAPDDGHIQDVYGLVSLFTGNFEDAARSSNPSYRESLSTIRSGYRNIFAAASFHLGSHRITIAELDKAGEQGDPLGAPRLAYLAAAKYQLGDISGARLVAAELDKTWPDARVDLALLSMFRSPEDAQMVIGPLTSSGWRGGTE